MNALGNTKGKIFPTLRLFKSFQLPMTRRKNSPSQVTRWEGLKLCLLNTTSRADSEEKRTNRNQLIEKVKGGAFKEVAMQFAAKFVFNTQVLNDVENMLLEVGEEAFINQELSMLNRRDTKSVLSSITCPTVIVHTSEDAVFSLQEHQEMADLIKNSTLVTLRTRLLI